MEASNQVAQSPTNNSAGTSQVAQSVKSMAASAENFDSFDDLDDTGGSDLSADSEKGESDGQESEKQGQEEEQEVSSEAAADAEPEAPAEEEAPADAADSEEVKEEPKEGEEPAAPIVFKAGDKEIPVSADAVIQVPVNGKLEDFQLKDIISEFSGKTDWTRKYSALDVERKQFQNQVVDLDSKVNQLHDLAVTQKKPREAIAFLAEAMGADPREVWQSLKTQIKEAESKLAGLSEEEIEAQEAKEEADYYRNKLKNQKEAESLNAQKETLKAEVKTVMDQYGLSKEQFKSLYDELAATAEKSNIDLDTLTPELVGQWHQQKARQSSVRELVGKSFASAPNKAEIMQQLSEVWASNPTFSLQDIEDIGNQVFAPPAPVKAKSSLMKKLQNGKKIESARKEAESVPETWDDL